MCVDIRRRSGDVIAVTGTVVGVGIVLRTVRVCSLGGTRGGRRVMPSIHSRVEEALLHWRTASVRGVSVRSRLFGTGTLAEVVVAGFPVDGGAGVVDDGPWM